MSIQRFPIPAEILARFCTNWGVAEFYVFGSVLRGDFGPTSDLDVAVRFLPDARYSLFDLGDMRDELALLAGRPVDLLTVRAIEHMPNPLRRQAILGSMELVHAA